jgi:ribosome-associated translation inhibitor RaiA
MAHDWTMIDIDVTAEREIPRKQVDAARKRFEALERYIGHPPEGARLTLRRGAGGHSDRDYVADASVLFEGRLLAAHTAGPTPEKAAEEAAERLRRQLRRVVGAEVAQRNEPAVIQAALEALDPDRRHRPEAKLKPPEEREIVYRHNYPDKPLETLDAVVFLLDLDREFQLFRHARTWEDVVVYRRDDGRIGLIFPPGSELAHEDHVVPEPSRYTEPLTADAARAEMDELNHRFLYFIDADDGR